MTPALLLCAYCELTEEEIVASGLLEEDELPLTEVRVNDHSVNLCPACRARFTSAPADHYADLLAAPVDFPPGVTAVEHCCPELEFRGIPEDEATFILTMERRDAYMWAQCEHCKVVVRSLAEEDEL
jgi:predicted anti-sigma-YlaC factor YlaD